MEKEHRGKLLPMGRLLEIGKPPFTGESGNSLLRSAIGHNNISVTTKNYINTALSYTAHNDGNASVWSIKSAIVQKTEMEKKIGNFISSGSGDSSGFFAEASKLLTRKRDLLDMQISAWDTLSEEHRDMVEKSFPVLYGLRGVNTTNIGSKGLPGEAYVRGSVKSENIAAIYVKADEIENVKRLLSTSTEFAHIAVSPIEPLYKL